MHPPPAGPDAPVEGTRLDSARRRRAIRDSISAQMMGIVFPTLMRQAGLASLVLIALAPTHSEFVIGVAFLIMQGAMLVRVVVAPIIDRVPARHFMVRWVGVSAVFALLLPAGPALGWLGHADLGLTCFLAALAACFVAMEVGVSAWFPLLHHIVPPAIRGRYFGSMRRAWQLTSVAAVLLSAAVLGDDPGFGRLLVVLTPAVLLQGGRVWFYNRLPELPAADRSPRRYHWHSIVAPLRDRAYVQFVGFVLLVSLVQYAALPFAVPFLRLSLAFPASTTLYTSAAFGLGSALTLPAWGRLADHRGTRTVFLLGGLGAAGALVLLAATPDHDRAPWLATIAALTSMLLAGGGTAGISIAYTVRLMRLAPGRHVAPYMNLSQAGIGLIAGMASAAAGALLALMPPAVTLAGLPVLTFRLFFATVAVGLLGTLVWLCWLPRLGEPPLWPGRRAGGHVPP